MAHDGSFNRWPLYHTLKHICQRKLLGSIICSNSYSTICNHIQSSFGPSPNRHKATSPMVSGSRFHWTLEVSSWTTCDPQKIHKGPVLLSYCCHHNLFNFISSSKQFSNPKSFAGCCILMLQKCLPAKKILDLVLSKDLMVMGVSGGVLFAIPARSSRLSSNRKLRFCWKMPQEKS